MRNGEITAGDVQRASGPEGLSQLLTKLGYDVSEPLEQTATSLGVTERVHHAIKQVRRLAADRAMPGAEPALVVYWFEVTGLTADTRKAVVSAFRNRFARTLVILTTKDFDPIDFALVEPAPREAQTPGGPTISHRLFSLDRRNPGRVHLRVVNRMRNTASDPYAQFDRLKDAFRLAEWSEDEFNNRNLFSDYFLKHRLPDKTLFPVFHQDVRAASGAVSEAFASAGDPRNLTSHELGEKFIGPLFAALGFEKPEAVHGEDAAHYLLEAKKDGASSKVVLLIYPWDRSLDRKDDKDKDLPEDVPGIRVVKALEHHGVPWAILTDGKLWRLYCAAAHSRASNYYEVNLPETLDQDDLTAFRYFYLFFRAAAFAPIRPLPGDDSGAPACFLDHLRAGSAAFAKEVGDKLRAHIFDEVFPYLAQGFVEHRKKKYDETTTASDPFLDEVYDATLTLLYRLLFLLYAESLDLVPVHEPAYAAVSLSRLKQEIADAAGPDTDAVEKRLKDRFNQIDTGLYRRLSELFEVIDDGSKDHNVPAYNGGLFETSPKPTDQTREAMAARFLAKHRVPDFFLARVIDLLARGEDTKTHSLVFVDYKALGVRQLGNIYEGLLMYHVVIPRDEWEKGYQRKGLRVALVPSNKERKSSGSYFTPEHIVKYIVSNTVGPLLTEKFEALAPKLRTIQREYRETREFERNRAERTHSQPRTDDSIAHGIAVKHETTVWELFDLKVLDPAMGSGHFLVETVDFITDRVLDFLAAFPWNPVQVLIDHRIREQIIESLDQQGVKINEDRLTDVNLIKRMVMKRCVYGVDLNPMAVELAKVSLWLDSFTLGAPLSFMDHHLKCGNSLIGATIADLRRAAEAKFSKTEKHGLLFSIPMEPLELATRNMELIADLTDATLAEVTKSAATYDQVIAGIKGYRSLLDCLTAEHFGVEGASQLVTEGHDLDLENWSETIESLSIRDQRWVKAAADSSLQRRFFHWDIDFPDVFFTKRREAARRAFDAVVGNPPYVSVTNIAPDDRKYFLRRYRSVIRGRFDVYVLFIASSLDLLRPYGKSGSISPIKFCVYPYGRPLRTRLLEVHRVRQLIDISQCDDVFPDPSTYPCILLVDAHEGSPTHAVSLVRASTRSSIQVLRDLEKSVVKFSVRTAGDLLDSTDAIISVESAATVEGGLLQKIANRRPVIGDFFAIEQAIRVGSKEARRDLLLSRDEYEKLSPKWRQVTYPVLDGSDIRRYQINWPDRWLLYDPSRLYNAKTTELLLRDKVLVKRVAERLSAVYERGIAGNHAHPLNTIYIVHPMRKPHPNEAIVTVLLNSAVLDWWYRTKYQAICVRGGYVEFRENLKHAPLPHIVFEKADAWRPHPPETCASLAEAGEELSALLRTIVTTTNECVSALQDLLIEDSAGSVLREWTGGSILSDLDYMGWESRYPTWERSAATDGLAFADNIAPPLRGEGPEHIPWSLIARVYPSFRLPEIDYAAWESAAWEELCSLLRRNKRNISSSRVRADLTGRGVISSPAGSMRKLQETFLKYHRELRDRRAKAAEIDFLIDRIVFSLFDLTLEEQKLILSRVGPGRPLPPRRGKRKTVSDARAPMLFD